MLVDDFIGPKKGRSKKRGNWANPVRFVRV